jgi:DNA invertase Pin-like site-specific DNA recombinase
VRNGPILQYDSHSPAGRAVKLGYARVSTEDQSLDVQRQKLTAVGCEMVFEEKVSGARRHRPELERLLGQIRKGDVLVISRLDRLARSTAELLRITEVLTEKSAGLQSLDEPWADTTSPSGRMVLTVFAGIAEFARHLIRSRTEDARRAALARGVAFGRPRKMSTRQAALARELIHEGKSISEVARTFNVHPATIYRCLEDEQGL